MVEKGKGFDTLSQTFVRIWREEGVVGLFKGNGTNILRIVPYSSVQFSTYELLQRVSSVNSIYCCLYLCIFGGGGVGSEAS